MKCWALGQNGHPLETPVVGGFDTENGSVTTLSLLTLGYSALAADSQAWMLYLTYLSR